jgi:hypothetical protein
VSQTQLTEFYKAPAAKPAEPGTSQTPPQPPPVVVNLEEELAKTAVEQYKEAETSLLKLFLSKKVPCKGCGKPRISQGPTGNTCFLGISTLSVKCKGEACTSHKLIQYCLKLDESNNTKDIINRAKEVRDLYESLKANRKKAPVPPPTMPPAAGSNKRPRETALNSSPEPIVAHTAEDLRILALIQFALIPFKDRSDQNEKSLQEFKESNATIQLQLASKDAEIAESHAKIAELEELLQQCRQQLAGEEIIPRLPPPTATPTATVPGANWVTVNSNKKKSKAHPLAVNSAINTQPGASSGPSLRSNATYADKAKFNKQAAKTKLASMSPEERADELDRRRQLRNAPAAPMPSREQLKYKGFIILNPLDDEAKNPKKEMREYLKARNFPASLREISFLGKRMSVAEVFYAEGVDYETAVEAAKAKSLFVSEDPLTPPNFNPEQPLPHRERGFIYRRSKMLAEAMRHNIKPMIQIAKSGADEFLLTHIERACKCLLLEQTYTYPNNVRRTNFEQLRDDARKKEQEDAAKNTANAIVVNVDDDMDTEEEQPVLRTKVPQAERKRAAAAAKNIHVPNMFDNDSNTIIINDQ